LNLRRIAREPLLHFLLIGLVLFLVYGRVAPDDADGRRIVVGQAQVDALARQFAASWNRPPTAPELRALVDSHVRDEILYREGAALGLDRDDAVVKRRVRQKYEVLSEELLAQDPPTDADLAAYLRENADAFRRPPVVSFEQVLVAQAGSSTDLAAAIATARRALERGTSPDRVGMSTLLPARASDRPLDLVAREFGDEFARQLDTLPVGAWSGPVTSGFGAHLVRLERRTPGVQPSLDEVRPAVVREWENARRKRAREANLAQLLETYEVVVEADLRAAPVP
jgi:hypothetical protein